jgi:hypothetical protein
MKNTKELLRRACRARNIAIVFILARALKIKMLPRRYARLLGMKGCIKAAKLINPDDLPFLFRKFTGLKIADDDLSDYVLRESDKKIHILFLHKCKYEFSQEAREFIIGAEDSDIIMYLKAIGHKFNDIEMFEACDNGSAEIVQFLHEEAGVEVSEEAAKLALTDGEYKSKEEMYRMLDYLCEKNIKFPVDALFDSDNVDGITHVIRRRTGWEAFDFEWNYDEPDYSKLFVSFKIFKDFHVFKITVPVNGPYDHDEISQLILGASGP